jgi:hypothetical protein
MVSPAVALSIAPCIGVPLALNAPPSHHQPVSFTQMSPQLQGTAETEGTAINANITTINSTIFIIFFFSPPKFFYLAIFQKPL